MNAIAPPIQAALDLFRTELAELRFADIDAQALARAVDEVEKVAAVVASAQAALDSARVALEERQAALLERVQRAVAYARVYAENDDALQQKIDGIRLPRPARGTRAQEQGEGDSMLVLTPQAPPRRRGRPRKVTGAEQPVAEAE